MSIPVEDIIRTIGADWVEDTSIFNRFAPMGRGEVRSTIAAALRDKVLISQRRDGQRWIRRNVFTAEDFDTFRRRDTTRLSLRDPDVEITEKRGRITVLLSNVTASVEACLSVTEAESLSDKLAAFCVQLRGQLS